MRRRSRSESGFTLIELMLAFALFSLMLVATYQVISHATRSREVAQRRARLLEAAAAMFERLEREIQTAYVATREADQPRTVFVGLDRSDDIPRDGLILTCQCGEIWTLGLADSNRTPHTEVAYEFAFSDEYDATVLFRREDQTMDADPEDGGFIDPLWPEIRGMNLRFLDPASRGWKDSWDSAANANVPLPQAVEVTLYLGDPDAEGADQMLVVGKTIVLPTVFPAS
ncbi:MAG: prepilin-type N-terminal cleavage/methylation domain-containing protein [Candidatus Dadabacteria bacterium]|nr:MAG: prepilin-type N-terminal cleavage/methylation domain-containing protein [Candidatus Dadabacteria bacterium]